MTPYDEAMRYMPLVMRRLRLRAGHKTQTSALRAIRKNTGAGITKARMCEWEMGRTAPSLRSLFAFLMGLGYDWKDFQDEVDHLVGTSPPPPPPPPSDRGRKQYEREMAELRPKLRAMREQWGDDSGG